MTTRKTGQPQTLNDRLVKAIVDLSAIHMTLIDRRDLTLLVRAALDAEAISSSKARELLGLSVEDGRVLFAHWEKKP